MIMAVKLLIDIGNTQVKAAVYDGLQSVLTAFWNPANPADVTEGISKIRKFLDNEPAVAAILASVSETPERIEEVLNGIPVLVVLGPDTPLPIGNAYVSRETLGNDRIACAVAAVALFPGCPVLSIDAGTCIKYDFVDAEGNYQGGAISPGIRMRLKAMHTFTARLPLVELSPVDHILGKNTHESLLIGALGGARAEAEGMIEHYRKEYPGLKVVLTGGDLRYFEEPLKNSIFAVPDLLMQGLNLILEHNAQKK